MALWTIAVMWVISRLILRTKKQKKQRSKGTKKRQGVLKIKTVVALLMPETLLSRIMNSVNLLNNCKVNNYKLFQFHFLALVLSRNNNV